MKILLLALWTAFYTAHALCVGPRNGAPPVAACKCGYPAVEDAFAQSRAVFTAVVTEVHDIPVTVTTDGAGTVTATLGHQQPVVLRVTRSWKGVAPGGTITVLDATACGVGFRTGEEYLVYALAGEEGALVTSPCQRTRALTPPEASQDFLLPPISRDVAALDSIVRARRP